MRNRSPTTVNIVPVLKIHADVTRDCLLLLLNTSHKSLRHHYTFQLRGVAPKPRKCFQFTNKGIQYALRRIYVY